MGLSVLMFLVTFVYPFSYCFANFSQIEEETASAALHNPGTMSIAVLLSLCLVSFLYLLVSSKLRRVAKGGPHE